MLKLNILNKTIDQTWSIKRISKEAPPKTWETILMEAEPELNDISNILDDQEKLYGQFFPLKKDTFSAFEHTPLNNVKLVIIGQDPYHQMININGVSLPRAVGLSFSVRREDSIPSSLNNIYAELVNTVRGFTKPNHGDLREWCAQGVLLLNTCLTVKPNQPGSHGDIWLDLMYKVFRAIEIINPTCIFLLWGKEAQKLEPMLGDKSIVLKAAHPSGFSANRGFFGCNHFNIANDHLKRQGKIGINWKISSLEELRGDPRPVYLPPSVHIDHKPQFAPITPQMLPNVTPIIHTTFPMILNIPSANVTMVQSNLHKLNTVPMIDVGTKPVIKPVVREEPEETPKEAPIIPKIQFTNITPPFVFNITTQTLPIIISNKPSITAPILDLPNISPLNL